MAHFGLVTIGQSPRDDVLSSMLPPDLRHRVLERGALDDLPREAIDELQPQDLETPLVTRLSNGEEVLVSKERLMVHLQRAVDRIVDEGANALAILCTGSFPELRTPVPLLLPDRLLQANVNALIPSGTLGVIMPHHDQMEMMRRKWETLERTFIGVAASPYTSSEAITDLGTQLDNAGVDLIVMDCMGFTDEMKQRLRGSTSVPVILANRLIGRIIEELIAEPAPRSDTSPFAERIPRP